MSARPQNVGIKAIEVYFPSQVCWSTSFEPCPVQHLQFTTGLMACPVCRPGGVGEVRWSE